MEMFANNQWPLTPAPSFAGEILVVDDTPSSIAYLSALMASAGYEVRLALDGRMAIESISTKLPDLILLDVRMPGIDGFEICWLLKTDERTSNIPIIFLSGLDDTEAKLRGFALGAIDYIPKPFHDQEVLLRVRNQIDVQFFRKNLESAVLARTEALVREINVRRETESALRESTEKLRELSNHLVIIREEERKSIARELHDEIGQSLTVARINLHKMQILMDAQSANACKEHIESLASTLDHTANVARSISENLRPGLLDIVGLEAAIEQHVHQFINSTSISCRLEFEGDTAPPREIEITAFRIIQEALTNVSRHAHATHVHINIEKMPNQLVLVIDDNGCGFTLKKNNSKKFGFGLIGMRERIEILKGRLEIESELNNGTRIEVHLPYTSTQLS